VVETNGEARKPWWAERTLPTAYKNAWNRLFVEIRDRLHVDLKTRYRNQQIEPLDAMEDLGIEEQSYGVCCIIFPLKTDM